MFTIEQIKAAHSKVRSGADFPGYIQELKQLGVSSYITFVSDGHTDYVGINDYKVTAPAKYEVLAIADEYNEEQFKKGLKEHQQGKTDYSAFIAMCAQFGVEKWDVCMDEMTCIYYDRSGNQVLVEKIPS